jgi:hypothetical protein
MTRHQTDVPKEFDRIREMANRAILPLKPADATTRAEEKFLFTAKRTEAGRLLPPYYLIYFLLVDLLGFNNLGKFEKLAWSVPVDLDGVAYLIEHRKLGIGVFAHKPEAEEHQAQRIVQLIHKGVKVAQPYFRWRAETAVQKSKFNIANKGRQLFDRYEYFRDCSKSAAAEAEARKEERIVTRRETSFGNSTTYEYPSWKIARNAGWMALAAVDAFFAWTEHIFIHMAILQGIITTGDQVAKLAGAEWSAKFKCAVGLDDRLTKSHFDKLIVIRRQLRNFMAHGAFGKEGEAFSFHSGAGAVPVAFDYRASKPEFSLTPELAFDDAEAIETVEKFILHMWSGSREPAKIYIQEFGLPIILTFAGDGTYRKAMSSMEDMQQFAEHLGRQVDDAANMDW